MLSLDWRLLPTSDTVDPALAYHGVHTPGLVATSVVVAALPAFVALSIVPRIAAATTRRARWAWTCAGAISVGGAIWAMHFIAMLAFSLPCGIDYNPFGTVLSMIPGALAGGAALNVMARPNKPPLARMVGAAGLMGGGICAMHYAGMAALRPDALLRYDPALVALSITIAVVFAFAALAIRFRLDHADAVRPFATLIAALVMSGAIAGMHYTAMRAAMFFPLPVTLSDVPALPRAVLGLLIAILAVVVATSTCVAAFAGRQSELANSLRGEMVRREALEYEARSGRARLQAIFDAAADAIVTIDTAGHILQWSSGAQRVFGYTAEEVVGHDLTMLMPEPHHSRHHHYVRAFLDTRNPKIIGTGRELTALRKDGSEFPIELTVSEVRVGDEQFFTGILRDITARKQAEHELIRARQEAEAANLAKSQFLATMSHEIRTPMNGVLGMANLLAATQLNVRQNRLVENVIRSGQGLLAIINDILDFSRIEAGRLELSELEFEPQELIAELAELFGEACASKGLEFVYYVANDVPTRLTGDVVRLRQVLTNLIGNAIKFTERGEILVEVALTRGDAEQVTVGFAVQDTGIGIPPQQRTAIFDSFHQVDNSMSRSRGGSGLGLAISKQLVALMGGSIEVESEPGRGSRFSFTIRAGKPVAAPPPQPATPIRQPCRTLLVDCNTVSAHVMSLHLARWQVDATVAATAEEAEAAAGEALAAGRPFKVAIVDIKGLGQAGIKLVRRLRADRDEPPAIILLPGMDGSVSDATIEALGVYAALPKPVRPAELFDCLVSLSAAAESSGAQPWVRRRIASVQGTRFDARILVVEDNPVNQEVAMGALEAMGCRFVTAVNGRAAVQLFAQESFNLILMDCEMPVMDGFEATRRIREIEGLARQLPRGNGTPGRVPIIALTVHSMAEVREKCLTAGMDDFLVKPFDADGLTDMLRRWIGPLERGAGMQQSGMIAPASTADEHDADPTIDAKAIAGIRAMAGSAHAALLQRVVAQFSSVAPTLAAAIREKSSAGDNDALWRAAHSLKSSAAAVGASQLSRRCGEIEKLARAAETDRLAPLLSGLDADLAAAVRGLQELA